MDATCQGLLCPNNILTSPLTTLILATVALHVPLIGWRLYHYLRAT